MERVQDEALPIIPFLQLCGKCRRLRFGEGFGTALKPSFEPIVIARKPFKGTVLQNVLANGGGVLNIDAVRIGAGGIVPGGGKSRRGKHGGGIYGDGESEVNASPHTAGRWPANVALGCACENEHEPDCAVRLLDEQSGTLTSGQPLYRMHRDPGTRNAMHDFAGNEYMHTGFGDSGGASRFFFTAKASRAEREHGLEGGQRAPGGSNAKGFTDDVAAGNDRNRPVLNPHPTVKPLDLMRWLVRLVTQPGETVLDPFAGSGTTGVAAVQEGRHFIGIEREPEYVEIARRRIGNAPLSLFAEGAG